MKRSIIVLSVCLFSNTLLAATGAYYSKTKGKCIEFNIDDGTIPAYKTLGSCKLAHQVVVTKPKLNPKKQSKEVE
ncbi:MAG: hypothetical protein JKY19_10970 [Alcanivoracaceae bacterium]|nr:hypothetical protein [Alcanivoracaceae bacterium]